MKINKSAWSALQSGTTSRQLKDAARDRADKVLFWLAVVAGVSFFLPWEWALGPALMAILNGARSVDASKLAPEIEALEDMLRETSSG